MSSLVQFDRVAKHYGSRIALTDFSLEVHAGEVVALLGPNGAGKSTAFGVMLGHIRPTSGEVRVRGISVQHDRRRALRGVGAVPESPAFYEYLTGGENLRCLAAYSGPVDAATLDAAVRFVGLTDRIDDPVAAYSRGMRQRLALAQALVPTPEVVVLDEPAEGLDPDGIADMHALVARLRDDRGLGIVMASHLLAELEPVCDRVAVLDAGRVVFAGPWQDAETDGRRFRLALDDWARAGGVLADMAATRIGDEIVEVGMGCDVADLVAALVRAGVRVGGVEPVRSTLLERYRGRSPRADGR